MGIRNLMKFIEHACQKTTISELKQQNESKVVAIDVSCLIHKALYTGQSPVVFIKRYVRMLRIKKFQVILVFDGLPNPIKNETNIKRKSRRESDRKKGEALLEKGDVIEAMRVFRRCTSISRTEVREIIYELRSSRGIEVIEAPYEADAQLAYLALNGLADFIVTEDSDLVVYGCKKILFKLKLNGECILYDRSALNLDKLSFEDFRKLCILSGCDYLPGGLKGIGIRKGIKMLEKCLTIDKLIDSIVDKPSDFVDKYQKAEDAFLYSLIYDPINQLQRPLTLKNHSCTVDKS